MSGARPLLLGTWKCNDQWELETQVPWPLSHALLLLQDLQLFQEAGGWDVVSAVAEFWCSRVEWSPDEEKYHLRGEGMGRADVVGAEQMVIRPGVGGTGLSWGRRANGHQLGEQVKLNASCDFCDLMFAGTGAVSTSYLYVPRSHAPRRVPFRGQQLRVHQRPAPEQVRPRARPNPSARGPPSLPGLQPPLSTSASSLRFAAALARDLGQPVPSRWLEVADKIKVPFDPKHSFHPEFDGYEPGEWTRNPSEAPSGLSQDLAPAVDSPPPVSSVCPPGEEVKQADVVLLGYPVPFSVSPRIRRRNLEVYEAVTSPHGPAMTWVRTLGCGVVSSRRPSPAPLARSPFRMQQTSWQCVLRPRACSP